MIFQPDSLLRQREQILHRVSKGELPQSTAIEQLLALWPDDAVPYALQGQAYAAAGDFHAAEASFWKALERSPCSYFVYSSLAESRLLRDSSDRLGKHLRRLALWKLAVAEQIPDPVVAHYRDPLEKAGADPSDPYTYEVMAEASDSALSAIPLSAEDAERLLPYELLSMLQSQAPVEVDSELLQQILANPERVIPIWRAALREWALHSDRLSPEALDLIVATLGEIGGPELIDELLELSFQQNPEFTLHVHWAIHRLGTRFPAEVLERFRAAGADASLAARCSIAEQLVLLPAVTGRGDTLASLLDGLTKFSHDPDAAYLLMIVIYGVDEGGEEERAERLLSASESALAGKARKQLRKMLETDFIPSLLSIGLDELDIKAICLDRALMPAEEDDEEDEGDDDFGPPVVKPGRNDPCWCGSGKKYKKCHLPADEDEDEERNDANSDGV